MSLSIRVSSLITLVDCITQTEEPISLTVLGAFVTFVRAVEEL
jgi:hypothetical protein